MFVTKFSSTSHVPKTNRKNILIAERHIIMKFKMDPKDVEAALMYYHITP